MILFWAASEWRHGGAHVNICHYRWTMLILERRYILKISTSEHCLLLSLWLLFFHRKGKKPILILRTQLSVRVHSILGNYLLHVLFLSTAPSLRPPAAEEWWLRGNFPFSVCPHSHHSDVLLTVSWEDFLPLSQLLIISLFRQYRTSLLSMK